MTTTTALQALTNACDILEKTKVCSQVSEVFSSVDKALKLCNSAIAALSAAQDPPAEPDPHGTRYHCERAALALGHLSDDELANGAFMNYDQKLDIARALVNEPGYHPPIVWMTAVKDRIRWLSRQLAAARASQSHELELQLRLASLPAAAHRLLGPGSSLTASLCCRPLVPRLAGPSSRPTSRRRAWCGSSTVRGS